MQRRAAENDARVLVVVSALSGTTNALQALIDNHADAVNVHAAITQIIARHCDMATELGLDDEAVLGARVSEPSALAAVPGRRAAHLTWQARGLAPGESLSSTRCVVAPP